MSASAPTALKAVDNSNWHVSYFAPEDGPLLLASCEFEGVRVIHTASVPFVYVNYETSPPGPFTDELVCRAGVEVREIMNGFDLKTTYAFDDDYLYDHVWRFHDDGQFGSAIVVHGPGEEIYGRHTYHLPWRFDFDVGGSGCDCFQRRGSAASWTDVAAEGRFRPASPPQFEWRVLDKATGRNVQARARVGDHAEVWALRSKPREQWASMGATGIGPPGSPHSVPALYDDNESLQDTTIVFWYIAHLPAVDRVAACGPWFALDRFPAPQPMPPPRPAPPEPTADDPPIAVFRFEPKPGAPRPKVEKREGGRTEISYLGHTIVIEKTRPGDAAAAGETSPAMPEMPGSMHDMQAADKPEATGKPAAADESKSPSSGGMDASMAGMLDETLTVDGTEVMVHSVGPGLVHMHDLPFFIFASVEDAGLAWVEQLVYGTSDGSTEKPEQAH